jgi:cytochrome b involved in lipid metabolism
MENFSVCYKPPTFRSKPSKSVEEWRMGKKVDDSADGLWRVHDKLYDLINFIPRHPGGQDWIQLTQGMDITELFETHHLTSKPEILLHNFYVCEAKARRNCRITFIDDGFYKTLRKKIADQMINVYRDGVERSKVSFAMTDWISLDLMH